MSKYAAKVENGTVLDYVQVTSPGGTRLSIGEVVEATQDQGMQTVGEFEFFEGRQTEWVESAVMQEVEQLFDEEGIALRFCSQLICQRFWQGARPFWEKLS